MFQKGQVILALLEECMCSCCGRHKDDRYPSAVTATVNGMGQQESQKMCVGWSIIVLTLFGLVLPCASCVLLLFLSLAQVAKLGFVSWSQAFQWQGFLAVPCPLQCVIIPSGIVRELIYSSFFSCVECLVVGAFCVFYEKFLV